MNSQLQVSPFNSFKMPSSIMAQSQKQEGVAAPIKIENPSAPKNETEAKKSHTKRNVIIGALAAATAGLIVAFATGKIKLPKFIEAKKAAREAAKLAAQQAAQAEQEAVKNAAKQADGNLAIGAFAVGLIAKCFKDSQTEDKEIEKLKKLVLENEDFIKNTELPQIQEEADQYAQVYNQTIIPKIEKLAKYSDEMYSRYDNDIAALNKDNGEFKEYFWPETNIKKGDFTRNEKTGATVMNLYDKEGKKTQTTTFIDNKPVEIVAYSPTENPYTRGRFSTAKDGKVRMTHFFVYDKNTAKPTGTLSFDENQGIKSYLHYIEDGKLDKVYFLNPQTLDLNAISLPDEEGKCCNRRYLFGENKLQSAKIRDKNSKLPSHTYYFDKDQNPVSMDVLGKDKYRLEVPFEVEN